MKLGDVKHGGSASSVIAVLALVALALIAAVVLWAVFYPTGQAMRVVEKTLDADNVIYNYEYFKQAYQDIHAMDKKIEIAQQALDNFLKNAGPRDKWDFRDKEESNRLETNLAGVRNVRTEMVATYNARVRMVNRSIFMGKDVPQQVE